MGRRKVKDNQTGEIFEIDESEAGNFGLSAPVTQPQLQQTSQEQARYITGHSLEEHQQALQGARSAGNKNAVKQIETDYDTEFQYQKEAGGVTKDAATLRKEFAKETKDSNFRLAQDAYKRTKEVPNTGAGDLSLIYSYIKALDPTSVVREGEINISKATGSVPENLLTAYQRVKEGKLLAKQQRAEYKGEIARFYNEKVKEQQQRNAFYSGLATDMQLDPQKIIGDVGNIQLAEIPNIPQQTQNQRLSGPLGFIQGLATGASDFLIPETKKRVSEFTQNPSALLSLLNPAGSPGISNPITQESVKNIPSLLELGVLRGAGGLVKGAISKVGGIFPKKGATAAAAKVAGELDTKPIVKAGEEYVKHNPLAKDLWNTIKPSIGQKTHTSDVLAKMFDVWKGAYSKTGDVRTTAEAQLYNKLYGAGRSVIEKQAPAVSKEISKLKFLHGFPEKISKVQKGTWLALKTTAIGKLLGL